MVIQLKMKDHEGMIPYMISRYILFLLFHATQNVVQIYFRVFKISSSLILYYVLISSSTVAVG